MIPPEAVKKILDAGRRSIINFLEKVVKVEWWVVVVTDTIAGYLIGKTHHVYKKWHEQPELPDLTSTRTWYGT